MEIMIMVFAVSYISMTIYETQGYEGEALTEARRVLFAGIMILITLVLRLLV